MIVLTYYHLQENYKQMCAHFLANRLWDKFYVLDLIVYVILGLFDKVYCIIKMVGTGLIRYNMPVLVSQY